MSVAERADMPGMAARSRSLRNASVAIRDGWLVWKSHVLIRAFADTTGEHSTVGADTCSH